MIASLTDIRVLALDVDGVLTDGKITFDPSTSQEVKTFHVHDGLGLSLWKKAGGEIVLISGRNAKIVALRAEELGINFVIQGSHDKIADLETALNVIGATAKQTAFVGDDLGDLAVMQHVGFAISVHNAAQEVQEAAHWITPHDGGNGAVRDAVEHIMKSSGTWDKALRTFTSETAQQ